MMNFATSILLLLSFTVTHWNHVKWENDNQVYIEDQCGATMRILGFNEGSKKVYPIFNGKQQQSMLWCFISNDGNYIVVTNRKDNDLTIIKDKKIVYKKSFREIIKSDSNRKTVELLSKKDSHFADIQFLRVYQINEDYITFCLVYFSFDSSAPRYFVKLNYHTSEIIRVTPITGYKDLQYRMLFVDNSAQGIPLNIVTSNRFYYNISEGKEKELLPEYFESEVAKHQFEGLYWLAGDTVYIGWNKTIQSYNLVTKEFKVLPLPAKVLSCKYRKLIVTKKYLYIATFEDQGREKIQFERLFRIDNYQEIKCPLFGEIRRKGWEIVSFSPSGNRIFVQDRKNNNAYFFDLPK
jgi:uncharacterized protein YqfB (UPF0267 family)